MQAVLATAKAAVNEATNVFVQAGALKAETIPGGDRNFKVEGAQR